MKVEALVFVGIRGSVVALNRATGEQLWATRLKGYDFVNVVLDRGAVFATSWGEIFCLDPLTGVVLWHNRPKGHRVEVFIQFGHEADAIAFHNRSAFDSSLVIGESRLRRQAGHAHVNTGFLRVASWVRSANAADFGGSRVKPHHINVVMIFWLPFGLNPSERSTLHTTSTSQRPLGRRPIPVALISATGR